MSNTTVSGFDLSAVTGSRAAYSVWVPFLDGCRVKIRYVSREQLREIARKATVRGFDSRTHQKTEEVDKAKWDQLLGEAAVEDWEGFRDGKEPFPCTPKNVDTLTTSWSVFAKFVGDVCVDLEALQAAEKEAERKNSNSGSSPESIILPSTARTVETQKPLTE